MNAMIFAAGLGSRLRPITNNCPKALVKVGDFTLLEMALKKMSRLGIKKVIVNVHHFASQVVDFIKKYNVTDMEIIISDESNMLLDTGGGLLNAATLFDKGSDILIYNVDIVTNADLNGLIKHHITENNLATLLIQERNASRYLMFDDNNILCGWKNPKTKEEKWVSNPKPSKEMGFNGIQIIKYEFLSLIKEKGSFPIIPVYLELAKTQRIAGWSNWEGKWFDVGTPEKLNNISEFILKCSAKEFQSFI